MITEITRPSAPGVYRSTYPSLRIQTDSNRFKADYFALQNVDYEMYIIYKPELNFSCQHSSFYFIEITLKLKV